MSFNEAFDKIFDKPQGCRKMAELTQADVRRLFDYDPATGILTNKVYKCSRALAGKEAGHQEPRGYRNVMHKKKMYKAHRLIWLYVHGKFPEGEIDHINGIRNDNRIANLRDVAHLENQRNRNANSNNASGVGGVGWSKNAGKWRAGIQVDGSAKHLGYFDDIEDAAQARKAAEVKYGFHPNHGSI